MGTNKFSKDIFPWYVGEFDGTAIDTSDDTIVLKSGGVTGTYTTVVYQDVGGKVQISWQADETTGSVNAIPSADPKVISIRSSDTKPIDTATSVGTTGLNPIYSEGMVDTGNGWVAVPTASYATDVDHLYASGLYLTRGYPIQKEKTDNAVMHIGSKLILEVGAYLLNHDAQDVDHLYASGLYLTRGSAIDPLTDLGYSDNTHIHVGSRLVLTIS